MEREIERYKENAKELKFPSHMGSSDIVYTIYKRIFIYLKERHIKLININKLGLKFPSHLAPICIYKIYERVFTKKE